MDAHIKAVWPEGHRLAQRINFRFPQFVPTDLAVLIPQASSEGVEIMNGTMQWDPNVRLSAAKCLQHPYFANSIHQCCTKMFIYLW